MTVHNHHFIEALGSSLIVSALHGGVVFYSQIMGAVCVIRGEGGVWKVSICFDGPGGGGKWCGKSDSSNSGERIEEKSEMNAVVVVATKKLLHQKAEQWHPLVALGPLELLPTTLQTVWGGPLMDLGT